MNTTEFQIAASNPFSTRFIRPGALEFEFPPGSSAEQLVRQLRANAWRGEIIGPHGSGKSTLLRTLIPRIEAAGMRVDFRVLDAECEAGGVRIFVSQLAKQPQPQTLLVVDGFERLSRWQRWRLSRIYRGDGCGLLVTAHRPVGLATLFETRPSIELAQRIVGKLAAGQRGCIHEDDVRNAYAANHGNLRETLFTLYDVFESRRSGEQSRHLSAQSL